MLDKFGIFKLLNSLISNFNGSKTQPQTTSKTDNEQNLLDNISNFFSSLNKGKENSNSPIPTPTNTSSFEDITSLKPDSFKGIDKKPRPTQPPINAKMISTMRSHDELIKRVYDKNKATLKK